MRESRGWRRRRKERRRCSKIWRAVVAAATKGETRVRRDPAIVNRELSRTFFLPFFLSFFLFLSINEAREPDGLFEGPLSDGNLSSERRRAIDSASASFREGLRSPRWRDVTISEPEIRWTLISHREPHSFQRNYFLTLCFAFFSLLC